ncbi:MAG TPA: ABC-2 family transporter protein [Chloroflexota bacterium]
MNALRVAWLFFRVGAMNELQYRVNFFLQLVQSLLAIGTGLVSLWLIFSQTSSLHGWNAAQLLIVMGIFTMMGGFIQSTIQPNMMRLMDDIQQGTLDYALTKPEDAQLLVSVREVAIWQMVDVLTGLIIVVAGVLRLQSQVGVGHAALFVLVLTLGSVIIYSFWMILTTIAFWVVRMDQIVEMFQGVYAAARYPVGIYPAWLQYGLTVLVPIAFAVTVPAEALTGRLTGQTLAGAAAFTIVLFGLTRIVWRFGLKRYSGASA